MTKHEVKEWLSQYDDHDALDDEDLEEAFAALYDRYPDDEDREVGVASLIWADPYMSDPS